MIKELPLLPEDWSQWDWFGSNYNATEEQTKKAYYALVNKGLCSDFAKEVWNDLIDLLVLTLETAGLEWDAAYCTSGDCRITEAFGALTAKAFNSVALNLNRLGTFRWKWEHSESTSGYLGRTPVRGFAQYGKQADYVYGRYILELATRYNQLVRILTNTADFAEFVSQVASKSNVNASLVVAKSAPIAFTGISKSSASAEMHPVPAKHLSAEVISSTKVHAPLVTAKSGLMDSLTASRSSAFADFGPRKAQKLDVQATSRTTVHAKLSELIYAARMQFKASSKTSVYADMDYWQSIEVLGQVLLGSIVHTALDTIPPHQLTAHILSESSADALLRAAEPFALQAHVRSTSQGHADMAIGDPMGIISHAKSRSLAGGKIDLPRPDLMYALSQCKSKVSADILIREPSSVEALAQSSSSSNTELQTADPKPIDSTAASKSTSHAEVTPAKPLALDAQAHSRTISKAELTAGRPMALTVNALIRSMAYADLTRLLPKSVVSYATAGTTVDGALLRKTARRLAAQVVSRTSVYAELTFYQPEPEDGWYDPVQTGKSLYIRSAYPQWQNGNAVHLDGGVYYEPEQTGNSVYIRSIDSVKGVG